MPSKLDKEPTAETVRSSKERFRMQFKVGPGFWCHPNNNSLPSAACSCKITVIIIMVAILYRLGLTLIS